MKNIKHFVHRIIILIIHYTTDFLFEIYHKLKAPPPKLPAPDDCHLLKSATQLAEEIRNKKVTSEEVVEAFIKRIDRVNGLLNALVQNRYDQARIEAKNVDQYVRSSDFNAEKVAIEKPFLGVPFTIKELVNVEGLYCTIGRKDRIGIKSTRDSPCVKMMKDAGAICLGLGNVPQSAMWWECSNPVYGTTNNPYDVRRSPGGSTGGDGSLVAASATPCTVGTDIAGSIRCPSFYNGIFGHMITPGTSDPGLDPQVPDAMLPCLTMGPMVRHAADLRPLTKILVPENMLSASLDKKIPLQDLKIFYMDHDGGNYLTTPIESEISQQIHRVAKYFEEKYNTPCVNVNITEFCQSFDMMIYALSYSGEGLSQQFIEQHFKTKDVNILWELTKSILGFSDLTPPVALTCCVEKYYNISPEKQVRIKQKIKKLREKFKSLLGDNGVFLYPPQPAAAPYHGQTFFRPYNHNYIDIFNVLGMPVSSCPTAINKRGLPIGVQVVGGPGYDSLCIQVAEEIEKGFGGWRCPSKVM